MAIAAIVYISVSALLVVSAGIFFVKAIQSFDEAKANIKSVPRSSDVFTTRHERSYKK